jgi:hypothetical protein
MGEMKAMHQMQELPGLDIRPADEMNLHVKPLEKGGFGVHANEITIAEYENEAVAVSHCMRLLKQQEQDSRGDE